MKPSRNERCPCGSGLKVKRCCGVDGVRRSNEAAVDLFGLALHFPRYRPRSPSFERWAATAPDALRWDALEAGLRALGSEEHARLATGFAEEYPHMWAALVDEVGHPEEAGQLVCCGAVVAGVHEAKRQLELQALGLLELDPELREDPVEALALVLEASDLWSVIESNIAVDAFDAGSSIGAVADRLAAKWHDERLGVLVERVGARLPVARYPLASAALERACATVAKKARLRRRLAAQLLLDSLPTVFDAIRAAA